MPFFSIITVCRNEQDTIAASCESVVSQTFRDFEWIIVDGHSADGTLDVLSRYHDHIHTLISEPDTGIYDAMNKGIRLAKGDYLIFLNGGDTFADKDVLYTASTSPPKDILYGDLIIKNENGQQFIRTHPDKLPKYYLLKNMMPHPATFFRKVLFEKYGRYDTSFVISGDFDLFVRLLYKHRVSCYHIPKVISVFHTNGISEKPEYQLIQRKENHRIRKKFPWFIYGLKRLKTAYKLIKLSRENNNCHTDI